VWELIFLMVVMKIPILYLCWVVWWAIKSEPRPEEGAALAAAIPLDPLDPGLGWRRRRAPRPRPARPHGGPSRAYPRTARAALARSRR
jgi:hypothetical protein